MDARLYSVGLTLASLVFLLGVGRPLEPGPPRLVRAMFQAANEQFVDLPELEDVYFEFDSWRIGPKAVRGLRANVRRLKQLGLRQILVEGHTDEWGSEEYNLRLGERRALAVRAAFIRHEVNPSLITTMSYGKARPRCPEHHRVCWAENRRVHLRVSVDGPSH